MKKILPIIALIIVTVAVSYLLVFRDNSGSSSSDPTASTATNQEDNTASIATDAGGSEKFTTAQVAEHDSSNDCWTIINDKVYNLTSYVPRHPGGDEILRACGTDGTSLFESRTTTDGQTVGGGGSHSGSAEAALNELRIGSLED